MSGVLHVPYKEPPARLTATARSRTLEAHYQGFLAVNRSNDRYDEYPLVEEETVADLVLYVGLRETLAFWELKQCARRVRRLTKGAIGFSQAIELLSKALGYRTYAALCHFNPAKKIARSCRTGPPVQFSMELITNHGRRKARE